MSALIRTVFFFSGLVLLSMQGCTPVTVDRSVGAAERSAAGAVTSAADSQWIAFGVVLARQSMRIDTGGLSEPGMRLDIILDDGRSLLVEQLISHAGELSVGNRVRVLQIGGFSRVTFWPYPASR